MGNLRYWWRAFWWGIEFRSKIPRAPTDDYQEKKSRDWYIQESADWRRWRRSRD